MQFRSAPSFATVVTAGGGVLAAAFLQAAIAAADPGDSGSDAGFTVGGLTFDDPVALPGLFGGGTATPGYELLDPLFSNAPLLSLGTDLPLGVLPVGSQQFTLEDSSGTTLGTVDAHTNVQDLLGIDSTQFTVTSTTPASGLTDSQAAELPADGTVYSITNLGGGFANVYDAVPNADGTAASSITDTFVTPFGNINVPTTYDAIAPLNAGSPLEALGSTSTATGLSDNAFTIGDTTFDPGSDGFNALPFPLGAIAPLLNLDQGTAAVFPPALPSQPLEVFSGGTDAGTAYTSVNASDLLGITSTQLTVNGVTPTAGAIQSALTSSDIDFSNADFTAGDLANAITNPPSDDFTGEIAYRPLDFNGDITGGDVTFQLGIDGFSLGNSGISASDLATVFNTVSTTGLPGDGTVYSVTDLGGGFENVYQAIPGTDGGAATSITDTFVTPFGDVNVPTSYDATAALNPGSPYEALGSTLSNAGLSDNAFTIGGTTFDPGTDGFTPVSPLFGIAPLLEIAGANLQGIPLANQFDVEMYDSSGTDLGSVNFGENVSNIFGIETSQLTISAINPAADLTAAQTAELPVEGTVYSVTNLGSGYENVYEAVPGTGGGAATITDTFVTPNGDTDLSSLFGGFDATAPLDTGAAVDGVSTAASSFDLFDPSTWF